MKTSGFVKIDDLKKLERIKQDIFDDIGPIKKNQFYFIGELGGDSEVKFMNAAQKKEYMKIHNEMLREMATQEDMYIPPQRKKPVK